MQRAVFGRELTGEPDALAGYREVPLAVRDPAAIATSGIVAHMTLVADPAAPAIAGMRYSVADTDLAAADAYEGADYARIAVTLASGASAFVYVSAL